MRDRQQGANEVQKQGADEVQREGADEVQRAGCKWGTKNRVQLQVQDDSGGRKLEYSRTE